MQALQDRFAPNNQCFGCGPKNAHGLQIKSMPEGDVVVASFLPKPHHQAFENVLSGGICGCLLDCHSNWCAAYVIMHARHETVPPCTVTARYTVTLLMPTPMDKVLKLVARPTLITPKKAEVVCDLLVDNVCTARCEGIFVAVAEGHPAYHRW